MANKQLSHVGVVRKWCIALGVLLATNISRDEAEIKLSAFVPLLMKEYPDAAFCEASLAHVARECKYFPTYGELIALLRDWWKDNNPQPRIAGPPQRTPSQEREIETARLAAEWDDAAGIASMVRNYQADPEALRLLHSAVCKFAPQHAHLVPAPVSTFAASDEVEKSDMPPRPIARYLTPEQLQAAGSARYANRQATAPASPTIRSATAGDPDASEPTRVDWHRATGA